MVKIISTTCCNTVLVYVLLKQIKFKLLLKIELLLTREFFKKKLYFICFNNV